MKKLYFSIIFILLLSTNTFAQIPILTIADVTVNEGNGTVSVPVTLSEISALDTVIDIVTTTGTASFSDYTTTTIQVTIPAGSTSTLVNVPIIDDLIDEPNETFTVDGTLVSGTIDTANSDFQGTVTIIDNDVLSSTNFSFSNLEYYPNPVKNSFEIKNASFIESIEIFSINGQKLYENSINDIYTKIDTSNFSKGIYVVKVKALGVEKTIKLVKE